MEKRLMKARSIIQMAQKVSTLENTLNSTSRATVIILLLLIQLSSRIAHTNILLSTKDISLRT